jgi:hypothetical protein
MECPALQQGIPGKLDPVKKWGKSPVVTLDLEWGGVRINI